MSTTASHTSVGSLVTAIRAVLPADTPWRLRLTPDQAGVELSCGRPPPGTVVAAAITDDGSSAAAVAYAQTHASEMAVPLRLVHVWTGASREADGVRMHADRPPHADLLIASAAYDTLDTAEADRVEREILHDADPAAALRAFSSEALLLVVGAVSGPVTVDHALGSTTRALIGRTACPLVVVLPRNDAGPLWW
jgi:nucleotide-binding universal stress UspA family protein